MIIRSLLDWLSCQCGGAIRQTGYTSFTTADQLFSTKLRFLQCLECKNRTSITKEAWDRLLHFPLEQDSVQWELKALGLSLSKNFTNRTFQMVYYRYTTQK